MRDMPMTEDDEIELTPEQKRRRRNRNIAIALALGGLVVLFYLITIVRIGGNVAERSF
jgi:hypothetical protein